MTTDKAPATLATAKHGGCVQLGASERERFDAWAEPRKLTLTRWGDRPGDVKPLFVIEVAGNYISPATQAAWEAWQHISAQPSPGGQGDALLESLVARWRNHAEEIGVSDNLLCQKIANCTMRHAPELQAALAARQPVAVSVPGSPTSCKHCDSTELEWFAHVRNHSNVQHGRLTTHDVSSVFVLGCNECSETLRVVKADEIASLMNAATPAQAVDLAMPIAMIDQALGRLSTTLDDLQSSPDRRPAVMVAEAIGCLHQALMGIPHG